MLTNCLLGRSFFFEKPHRFFLIHGQRFPATRAYVFCFYGIGVLPLVVAPRVEIVGVTFLQIGVEVAELFPAFRAFEHACMVAPPHLYGRGLSGAGMWGTTC